MPDNDFNTDTLPAPPDIAPSQLSEAPPAITTFKITDLAQAPQPAHKAAPTTFHLSEISAPLQTFALSDLAQHDYPSVDQAVRRSSAAELQTAMERGEREGGEEAGDFPTGIAPSKTMPPPAVPRPATPGLTGPYIAQGAFGPYAVPNDDDVDKGFEALRSEERHVHGVQALAGPVKALSSYIGQTAGPEYGAGYNPDVAAKPPLTAEQSKQGAKGLEDVLRGALNFAAPVAIPAGLVRPKA